MTACYQVVWMTTKQVWMADCLLPSSMDDYQVGTHTPHGGVARPRLPCGEPTRRPPSGSHRTVPSLFSLPSPLPSDARLTTATPSRRQHPLPPSLRPPSRPSYAHPAVIHSPPHRRDAHPHRLVACTTRHGLAQENHQGTPSPPLSPTPSEKPSLTGPSRNWPSARRTRRRGAASATPRATCASGRRR